MGKFQSGKVNPIILTVVIIASGVVLWRLMPIAYVGSQVYSNYSNQSDMAKKMWLDFSSRN